MRSPSTKRSIAALVALSICLPCWGVTAEPLSLADALESTRFATDDSDSTQYPEVSLSPSGARYVVKLITGDVKNDGVWMQLSLGSSDSFEHVHEVSVLCKLFTRGYEYPPRVRQLLDSHFNRVVWLDEHQIAFRWEDDSTVAQIVVVNVDTKKLRYVTHRSTDIVYFNVSPRRKLLYVAAAPDSTSTEAQSDQFGGSYVSTLDGFEIANGRLGESGSMARLYNRDAYILDLATAREQKLALKLRSPTFEFITDPIWSTDEHYVLVDAAPQAPANEWLKFTGARDSSFLGQFIRAAVETPESMDGRELTQLYIVDTHDGTTRPLWNAPTYPLGATPLVGAWSASGTELAIGPTILPGMSQSATYQVGIATVRVDSGQVARLPLEDSKLWTVRQIRWLSRNTIEVVCADGRTVFTRNVKDWRALTDPDSPGARLRPPAIKLTLEQDPNTPPRLFAVELTSGRKEMVLDPNPDLLVRHSLARAQLWKWRDAGNRDRLGMLYYPTQYAAGRRYPLVIQVVGAGARMTDFNVYGYGAGLGPSPSAYAAQMLAARGIAVISIERTGQPGGGEIEENAECLEGAIRALDEAGLIDSKKVGIMGFSRPGWIISQLITHSSFIYSAALVSDAIDTGYVTATLAPGSVDRENGGSPFGATLKNWLERSAGFNAERIRTPLRLEDESFPAAGLLLGWELFSRLRYLKLPVEYYVIPHIERGSHALQNPNQLIAVKQGAIDWMDFWLTGYEDDDPRKVEQYRRWHQLRDQRDSAAKIPRPPRLTWSSVPAP